MSKFLTKTGQLRFIIILHHHNVHCLMHSWSKCALIFIKIKYVNCIFRGLSLCCFFIELIFTRQDFSFTAKVTLMPFSPPLSLIEHILSKNWIKLSIIIYIFLKTPLPFRLYNCYLQSHNLDLAPPSMKIMKGLPPNYYSAAKQRGKLCILL